MEINRIEADRHLIGVGRELESLDGKAKTTLPVHVTEDGLRFYKRDPEGEWQRLYDAEQSRLTVGTLQAVVDYLNQNPDGLDLGKLLVHVYDVTTVKVMSIPFGVWKQRDTYMQAEAVVPTHRFGSWTSPDEFVPYLQSCFVPSDDLDALIKISGNLVDTSEVRVQDDGVSQEVSIRQGAGTQGRSSRTVPGGRLPVQHLRGSRAARVQGRVPAPVQPAGLQAHRMRRRRMEAGSHRQHPHMAAGKPA